MEAAFGRVNFLIYIPCPDRVLPDFFGIGVKNKEWLFLLLEITFEICVYFQDSLLKKVVKNDI